MTIVNDVHSQLNTTQVRRVVRPTSVEDVRAAILGARAEGCAVSVAGGRHAMGGQQFGEDTVLLDMRGMNRIIDLDHDAGRIVLEAGVQWPELLEHLAEVQRGRESQWGLIQKQTGADRLTLGGALAANVHGRGLRLKPIVADVESFVLVDADGEPRRCDRRENSELFRLAIGGYGLFGVITTVELRLAPRRKVERVVELLRVEELIAAVDSRIADGFLYGDFQFSTDDRSDEFLRLGVFSCYRPVPDETPLSEGARVLSLEDWKTFLHLAHTDKRRNADLYSAYYRSTSGQVYWSDAHQMSEYVDDYHVWLDQQLGAEVPGSEIITEIYVPRAALVPFLDDVRQGFRADDVDLIYGTIRFIERDDESFLAWAREPFACVIFNLCTAHSPEWLERSAQAFRRLIDLAIRYGGSYYLTYHRFATREQVERCYPQFVAFLRLKQHYDPEERFQSEWYRHYRATFADTLALAPDGRSAT